MLHDLLNVDAPGSFSRCDRADKARALRSQQLHGGAYDLPWQFESAVRTAAVVGLGKRPNLRFRRPNLPESLHDTCTKSACGRSVVLRMTEQTSSQRWSRVALPLVLLGIYSTLAVARTVTNALRDANLLRVSVGVVFGVVAASLLVGVLRSAELRRPRVLVSVAFVALAWVLVVWPMDSPEEKLHFVEYGVVGVLAFFASPNRWPELRRFGSAAVFTGAAGWLDEGIQALLPSRYYDLRDVGFNALAGVMALSALALVRFFSRR